MTREEQIERVTAMLPGYRRLAERIVDAIAQPVEVTDGLRRAAREVVDLAPRRSSPGSGYMQFAEALARLRAALKALEGTP